MRWDSPIVLVIAGSVAIHTLLVVFVDAIVVTHPIVLPEPAPVVEMVEVEVEPPEPPKPPEPPPVPEPLPEPEPMVEQPKLVQPQVRTQPQVRSQPEPPPEAPPTPGPPGGDDPPTLKMDDPVPGGRGILPPPAKGTRDGRGRGGSGGGTGGGSGSGDGTPPAPPPVSIATIKNPAMPKGDYGYIDAGKDYPAAARQLGIEGKLRVKLVVDATGKVRSALLLDSLGHGLDELALTRAKLIEFEPAKDTNDKAVTSVVIWTFNMALPK